jgi:hypothetical protein
MNYTEHADKMIKAGKAIDLTSKIFKFEKAGDKLRGEVVSVDEFTGSEYDTSCKRYTLETDDGRVSCILGGAADNQLSGITLSGRILCIEFLGKEETKTGKRFNSFRILDVSGAE